MKKFILAYPFFFMLVALFQWIAGAYTNECGCHPDEAAHYLSGLLVRDYLVSGTYVSPLDYAEHFYVHYPKLAIGHWPPLFHAVEGAWGVLFSSSRSSILVLLALCTTTLAFLVYRAVRSDFGNCAGLLAGVLMVSLPLVQKSTGMVMAEMFLALLCFAAALAFGHFLDTEKWEGAAAFSVLAVLAILTKGNGLCLALLPPLSVLLSGRFHLFYRRSFWSCAFIVVICCAPVYWIFLPYMSYSVHKQPPDIGTLVPVFRYYSWQLLKVTGIALSCVAATGFAFQNVPRHRTGKWAAVSALVLSVWAFHGGITNALAARHMVIAAPALVMLIISGTFLLARYIPSRGTILSAVIVGILFLADTFLIPKSAWHGFGTVARQLLARPEYDDSIFLVSSDTMGEGMFITEVAIREERPAHIVLRASQVLSKSNWWGNEYQLSYNTPQAMMEYLQSVPVDIVVIDLSVPSRTETADHRVLKETLAVFSHAWERIGTHSVVRDSTTYSSALLVYHLKECDKRPLSEVRAELLTHLPKPRPLHSTLKD